MIGEFVNNNLILCWSCLAIIFLVLIETIYYFRIRDRRDSDAGECANLKIGSILLSCLFMLSLILVVFFIDLVLLTFSALNWDLLVKYFPEFFKYFGYAVAITGIIYLYFKINYWFAKMVQGSNKKKRGKKK